MRVEYKDIFKNLVSPELIIGFWKIEESLEYLEEMYQPENEIEYDAIQHPQKKREWLASRLLLRILLQEKGIETYTLSKNEFGKPILQGMSYELSLTHTNNYAALILAHKPVGIDMESPSDKLRRVAHRFLSSSEQMACADDINLLCLYWSAKETIYKLYGKRGLHFAEQIRISSPDFETNTIRATLILPHQTQYYDLYFHKIENYWCVAG